MTSKSTNIDFSSVILITKYIHISQQIYAKRCTNAYVIIVTIVSVTIQGLFLIQLINSINCFVMFKQLELYCVYRKQKYFVGFLNKSDKSLKKDKTIAYNEINVFCIKERSIAVIDISFILVIEKEQSKLKHNKMQFFTVFVFAIVAIACVSGQDKSGSVGGFGSSLSGLSSSLGGFGSSLPSVNELGTGLSIYAEKLQVDKLVAEVQLAFKQMMPKVQDFMTRSMASLQVSGASSS